MIRSLRTDLPYRVEPDELDLEPTQSKDTLETVGEAETQAEVVAPNTTDVESSLEAAPLPIDERIAQPTTTKTQLYEDAAFLAQQLYEALVKQHGEPLISVVDNNVLQLLERYRVIDSALITVEYYSNAGTFFIESVLEMAPQTDNSLYQAINQIQELQKQGHLPGLEDGMTWGSGYIRLSVPGCRPVILLPTVAETK